MWHSESLDASKAHSADSAVEILLFLLQDSHAHVADFPVQSLREKGLASMWTNLLNNLTEYIPYLVNNTKHLPSMNSFNLFSSMPSVSSVINMMVEVSKGSCFRKAFFSFQDSRSSLASSVAGLSDEGRARCEPM